MIPEGVWEAGLLSTVDNDLLLLCTVHSYTRYLSRSHLFYHMQRLRASVLRLTGDIPLVGRVRDQMRNTGLCYEHLAGLECAGVYAVTKDTIEQVDSNLDSIVKRH